MSCAARKTTRKNQKNTKRERTHTKTMVGQFERIERERDDKTIPTRSKVKYMYIYKSKYLHFYKGPILSIYLYWICTGDGITLHTLYMYIFTVQYFFSQYNEMIYYSK